VRLLLDEHFSEQDAAQVHLHDLISSRLVRKLI